MANNEKLLEGLRGAGISIQVGSLARYMASNGVMVTPTVGRRRGYVSLNEKAYGIDLDSMNEAGSEFYRGRVSLGHLNFIPPKDEADLGTLEKRLRRAVERRVLADGGFLPMLAYESLKAEYEQIRTDYFAKRDEILDRWPLLIAEFESGAKAMLAGITMPDYQREQLLKSFMAEIPSESDYRSSFTMSLRVHAFPAECSLEGLNSSVAAAVDETWQDEVMTTAIAAIESLIGTMWAKCLTSIKQYLKGGQIKSRTVESLAKLADELSWKNVFRNPILNSLHAQLKPIQQTDTESQAEAVEIAIAIIFAYAKEAQLDLNFDNCPYTVEQLDQMVRMNLKEEAKYA